MDPESHSEVVAVELTISLSEIDIRFIITSEGKCAEAREYIGKALEITKNSAASYQKLGMVFLNAKDYKKAHECLFKALEVRRLLYRKNHPKIASVYGKIAKIFEKQGEYPKTFEYHNKALEIRKLFYGEKHTSIASCYKM